MEEHQAETIYAEYIKYGGVGIAIQLTDIFIQIFSEETSLDAAIEGILIALNKPNKPPTQNTRPIILDYIYLLTWNTYLKHLIV